MDDMSPQTAQMPSIDEILENFSLLEDWEDRYRYVIELGHELEPLTDDERTPENKVRGCASQVWFVSKVEADAVGKPHLHFRGDEILRSDPQALFDRIGLKDHLTQQRSNGLASMIARIRADAADAPGSAAPIS
jgi:cysteine desulfuration protein SufE